MKKDELKTYLDNCNKSLEGFAISPQKKLEECQFYLDSLQSYLAKEKFPYLKENVEKLSTILSTINKFLQQTKYLDPDLMEELLFFINGAFLDLINHADEIVDQDLESFKNNHCQKISFLNDWVKDFLKIIETPIPIVNEKFEKFMVFSLGKENFSIPIASFVEMVLLEGPEAIREGMLIYNEGKISLIDRKYLFGDYLEKFPKTVLILRQNNSIFALEVDQVVNFLNLNIKEFFRIEIVTGERYDGPIEYITILDNAPIFVLNPQSRPLRPLTT